MAAIATTSLFTPLIFILILLPSITADPPSSDDSSDNTVTPATNVSPSLAVALIVFVAIFFLSGVFFVALRQIIDSGYFGTLRVVGSFSAGSGGTRRGKATDGLSRAAIELIPTYFYKDVKMHRRVGKGEIECAVCLTEFEDHETLRLLPKCSHVFHPDCVDPWLLVHATCPICRTVLSTTPTSDSKTSNEHVITVDNLVPVSPGSNHSRPSEPDLSAEDNTGPRLQTPDSTGNIDSRFTLVLPDEEAANSRWQLLRATSQTKGLRASFSWCGRVGLNREYNPDRVHALSASHLPSPLSDTVSGYALSS